MHKLLFELQLNINVYSITERREQPRESQSVFIKIHMHSPIKFLLNGNRLSLEFQQSMKPKMVLVTQSYV